MKPSILRTSIAILLLAGLASACSAGTSNATEAEVSDKISITVSILPEKYFVERIGGNHVNVNVMVGPGDSPHTYEPKAEQMTALSNASIYFSIGVDFEKAWMERIAAANADMKIVDVSADLEKIPMTAHHHEGEGNGAKSEESGLDPHVWTSPENVKVIAQSIYHSLAEIDPANQADYLANLETFQKDIDTLETAIRSALSDITTTRFIVFHPSWGYFARDFGLEQDPIEIEGSEPSAQELAQIIDEAKAENIRVVFGQPEFSTKTADYIAKEISGQVILIDPLAEDWLKNLETVANTFADALK